MYKSYKDPKRLFCTQLWRNRSLLVAWGPLGVPWKAPWGALGALGEALGVFRGNLWGLEALLDSLWAALGRHRCTLTFVLRVKNVAGQKPEKNVKQELQGTQP